MPILRVWYKKRVRGAHGPVEIGLGGTHKIDCDPAHVPSERRALFLSYRQEVERLLALEQLGPSPSQNRARASAPPKAESRAVYVRQPGTSTEPAPDSHIGPPSRPFSEAEPYPYHPAEAAPSAAAEQPAPEVVSHERAAQFLKELQLRLSQKGRSNDPSAERSSAPVRTGHPSLKRLDQLLRGEEQQGHALAPSDGPRAEEELPDALAQLMLKQEVS